MASPTQVKQYLAYWFQLGKRVMLRGGREAVLPNPVIEGDHYSPSFEACWQQLIDNQAGDCYLEGTPQTVQDLLSSEWAIEQCARCGMPVPLVDLGGQAPACPCADLDNWPNSELPAPRSPINSQSRLCDLQYRLNRVVPKKLPTRHQAS